LSFPTEFPSSNDKVKLHLLRTLHLDSQGMYLHRTKQCGAEVSKVILNNSQQHHSWGSIMAASINRHTQQSY